MSDRNFDPLNETQLAEALAFENEDVIARAAEILKTADEWDSVPTIDSKEDAEDLTDFLTQMGSCFDTADDRRDKRKRVYDGPAKIVQKFFKDRVLDILEPRRKALKAKLNVYLDKIKAENQARALVALQEANRLMEEAKTAEQVTEAAKLVKKSQTLAKSAGIKTDFGSKAHQTSRWDFEVRDIAQVPSKFLKIDEVAIRAYMSTGTEASPVAIPGILVKRVSGLAV